TYCRTKRRFDSVRGFAVCECIRRGSGGDGVGIPFVRKRLCVRRVPTHSFDLSPGVKINDRSKIYEPEQYFSTSAFVTPFPYGRCQDRNEERKNRGQMVPRKSEHARNTSQQRNKSYGQESSFAGISRPDFKWFTRSCALPDQKGPHTRQARNNIRAFRIRGPLKRMRIHFEIINNDRSIQCSDPLCGTGVTHHAYRNDRGKPDHNKSNVFIAVPHSQIE